MVGICALAKIKAWSVFSTLHAFMSGSEEVGKLLGFSTSAGTWGSVFECYFRKLLNFASEFCESTMDLPKELIRDIVKEIDKDLS